jgi:site-specific recombinase XerC
MNGNVIALAGARVQPVTIEQAITHFLQRLGFRGYAVGTLRGYRSVLLDFAGFAGDAHGIRLIGLVSERLVQRWLDRLGHRGLGDRSQAWHLSILRSLCRHAKTEGWLDHDPTKDLRVRIRMRQVIAPEHDPLIRLINAIPPTTPMNLRDRAMLRVTFDAALRVGETCGLDVYDPARPPRSFVDAKRLLVKVVGKGGDDGHVGVNTRTLDILNDWLAVRERMAKPAEPALFVSRRGTRITRQMAHYRIKHWGRVAGLPRLHYHLLRHRRIGDVIDTLGLDAGQAVARHASRATTAAVYGAHAAELLRVQVRRECDLDGAREVA